ncbi:MAG: hypothetical protein Q4A41_00875 [Bacillota bacterium]|nr:hypothetical protein [Bacillota bacterium]
MKTNAFKDVEKVFYGKSLGRGNRQQGDIFVQACLLRRKKLERELDFYASERQEDLKRAGLAEAYEAFWNERTVVKTNIYGAIPVDALDDRQSTALMRYGWRIAEVDLSMITDGDSFDERLKEEDGKYIVLRERADDESLLLMRFKFQPLW